MMRNLRLGGLSFRILSSRNQKRQLGLAAVLRERPAFAGRRVGLVFTGGNIDTPVLAPALAAG